LEPFVSFVRNAARAQKLQSRGRCETGLRNTASSLIR
jgi:hypothetical protein